MRLEDPWLGDSIIRGFESLTYPAWTHTVTLPPWALAGKPVKGVSMTITMTDTGESEERGGGWEGRQRFFDTKLRTAAGTINEQARLFSGYVPNRASAATGFRDERGRYLEAAFGEAPGLQLGLHYGQWEGATIAYWRDMSFTGSGYNNNLRRSTAVGILDQWGFEAAERIVRVGAIELQRFEGSAVRFVINLFLVALVRSLLRAEISLPGVVFDALESADRVPLILDLNTDS